MCRVDTRLTASDMSSSTKRLRVDNDGAKPLVTIIWSHLRKLLVDYIEAPPDSNSKMYALVYSYIFDSLQAHGFGDACALSIRDWQALYHASLCTVSVIHGELVWVDGMFSYMKRTVCYSNRLRLVTPTSRLHRARFLLVARQLAAIRSPNTPTVSLLPVSVIVEIAYRAFVVRRHPVAEEFTRAEALDLWRSTLDSSWLDCFVRALPSVDECFAPRVAQQQFE